MEIIFGRKKSRSRVSSLSGQGLRSVPNDNVPAGSPKVTSRPVSAASISVPNADPSRTTNGTEPSLDTPQRPTGRGRHERAHTTVTTVNTSNLRPSSRDAPSTVDDSTTFSESTDTTTNEQPNPLLSLSLATRTHRQSQSGRSLGRRSPFTLALSPIPPTPALTTPAPSTPSSLPPSLLVELLPIPPTPALTTPASAPPTPASLPPSLLAELLPIFSPATPSDNYSSPYTPQTESHSSYRHGVIDDFKISRPDNQEIEAMFQNVVRECDLTDLPPLTLESKWNIVESDERLRWKVEKTKEEQAKKVSEQNRPDMIEEWSPELYLMKFKERSITPKDASGLLVSLRDCQERWLQQFIAMQGMRVLAQFVSHISRKGNQRTEVDHQLEYETLRCIKQILNSLSDTQGALTHNPVVLHIAFSLNSPRLAPRKLVVELLTFLAYRVPESLNLITGALETVSITNNVGSSPYAYWFASFEVSILAQPKQGKWDDLAGASDEVRKSVGTECNTNEYALRNLLLVNAILENLDDFDFRIHHLYQMAAAGLCRVIDLCRGFNFDLLNMQLDKLQITIESDVKVLCSRLDPEIISNMTNIEGVNDALNFQTHSTKANDGFLSTRDLQSGTNAPENEVTNGGDGFVGALKSKIARLEEKLQISHETTARLRAQLVTQKSVYEEQITQLKAQKSDYEGRITQLEAQLEAQRSDYEG